MGKHSPMKIESESFTVVREALERNYACMGVTCSQVIQFLFWGRFTKMGGILTKTFFKGKLTFFLHFLIIFLKEEETP